MVPSAWRTLKLRELCLDLESLGASAREPALLIAEDLDALAVGLGSASDRWADRLEELHCTGAKLGVVFECVRDGRELRDLDGTHLELSTDRLCLVQQTKHVTLGVTVHRRRTTRGRDTAAAVAAVAAAVCVGGMRAVSRELLAVDEWSRRLEPRRHLEV